MTNYLNPYGFLTFFVLSIDFINCNPFVGLPGVKILSPSYSNLNIDSILTNNDLNPLASLKDPENVTTEERIRSFGYPVEIHDVITKDGYILTMHRIPPHGRNFISGNRKPVLFQHGGFADSFSWLFNYPDRLLALRLAELGYDVWLANARGTMYSRRHVQYTDRDRQFFEFSNDEIAMYDIPAQIDYILNITGEERLFFVGVSLAPLQIHMTLSLFPEYNQKISLITSMAPTVYFSNTYPLVKQITNTARPLIRVLLDILTRGSGEFPPLWLTKLTRVFGTMGYGVCGNEMIGKICDLGFKLIYGAPFHPDSQKIRTFSSTQAFAPISTNMANQFLQILGTEKIQQYDFGDISENLRIYGSMEPPMYHLKDTTAPVAIFYLESDTVVSPQDVTRTASELSNVVFFHRVNTTSWGHLDFILGPDVNEVLLNHIIELFEKY